MSDAPEQKPATPATPVVSVPDQNAAPPAAPTSPKTNPVWMAAIVGGLLGGVFTFALLRSFPSHHKEPPPPPTEARQFADDVIAKLHDGKNDEFIRYIRPAFAKLTDEQFAQFRKNLFDMRAEDAKIYGQPGDFEFCRETRLSPTLARVTYLEKFAHGCVLWSLVVYNSPDGWQLVALSFQKSESGFSSLQ